MSGTLLEFIRKLGDMDGHFIDKAKVQTSYADHEILRQQNINDMKNEPDMQHQNFAECRIHH